MTDPTTPEPTPAPAAAPTSDPVDPGPAPDHPPVVAAAALGPAAPVQGDRGGWRATADQGLLLARWVAGELAAQWVEKWAFWPWVIGAVGLVSLGLSIPIDPGWPFIALGILLMGIAIGWRLTLAVVAWAIRRVALPRRARALRAEVGAARARLHDALEDTGTPISISGATRFAWDLFRGRRPHSAAARNLLGLISHLDDIAEIDRLRQVLADAAGTGRTGPGAGRGPNGAGG